MGCKVFFITEEHSGINRSTNKHLYAYKCIHLHIISTHTHAYIHARIHTYIQEYIYTHENIYIYTRICIHTREYIHTYMGVYIHSWIQVHIHTFKHTSIWKLKRHGNMSPSPFPSLKNPLKFSHSCSHGDRWLPHSLSWGLGDSPAGA